MSVSGRAVAETGESKELYSLHELAELLGVSYRHVHRAATQGKFKTVRLGALVRVPGEEKRRIQEYGW
jgi:excisionase family DNA binding protein